MRRQKIQKRLGYPLDTKLLIVHADDTGLCHAENLATFCAMQDGSVNSTSIMIPCPWSYEAVKYYKSHPNMDVGLHITITCEWETYKWGPLLPVSEVPSLVDKNGHFWDHDFWQKVKLEDVNREVQAQIDMLIYLGIVPSHLDCHMNCLMLREDLFELYVRLGKKYKVPIMVNKDYASFFNIDCEKYLDQEAVLVNQIHMARPENTKHGIENYYKKTIETISSGLNVMLLHPAYDGLEMQGISREIEPWGSKWRQADYDFFSSARCADMIRDNNIKVLTWKDISKVIYTDG